MNIFANIKWKYISTFFLINSFFSALSFINSYIALSFLAEVDFGKYVKLVSISDLLIPVLGLSLPAFISSSFYKVTRQRLLRFVDLVIVMVLLGTLALSFLFMFINDKVSYLSFENSQVLINLFPVIVSVFVSKVTIQLSLLEKKNGLYFLSRGVNPIVLFCSLVVCRIMNYSWEFIVVTTWLAAIFNIIIYLIYRKEKVELASVDKVKKMSCRAIYKFHFTLLPSIFFLTLIAFSDKFFLDYYFGVAIVGRYSSVFKLGMVCWFIYNSINQIYSPWLFENLNSKSSDKKKRIGISLIILGGSYLVVGILVSALMMIFAPHFLREDYLLAVKFIPLACLLFFSNSLCVVIQNFFYHYSLGKFLGLSGCISFLIVVLSHTLITGGFSIAGAFVSVTLGYVSYFIISMVLLLRLKGTRND